MNKDSLGDDGRDHFDRMKWITDTEIPIFTADRNFIGKWLEVNAETTN